MPEASESAESQSVLPIQRDGAGKPGLQLIEGDCLEAIKRGDVPCCDLVFTSPPYEDRREYGIGFNRTEYDWVDWAFERFTACCALCRGLVCWVVAGKTQDYSWTATPMLLGAKLKQAGINLWNPCIYQRNGIMGSGGKHYWRADYEWIIVAGPRGPLAWSDPLADAQPPKCKPGGRPSHRTKSGERVKGNYKQPALANPGNIVYCGAVGWGNIGDEFAHRGEAPFPESLAERFVRAFCPPRGLVFDPFIGSGTTMKAAYKHGRRCLGIDIRESQISLTSERLWFYHNLVRAGELVWKNVNGTLHQREATIEEVKEPC